MSLTYEARRLHYAPSGLKLKKKKKLTFCAQNALMCFVRVLDQEPLFPNAALTDRSRDVDKSPPLALWLAGSVFKGINKQ